MARHRILWNRLQQNLTLGRVIRAMLDRQFLFIALTLTIVGVILSASIRVRVRLRSGRMLRERAGETFDTFFASLAPRTVDESIARAVYDAFLPESRALAPWPVRPSDRLWKERGVDYPEELAEFLEVFLGRRGHPGPVSPREVDALRTVGDVAVWVHDRLNTLPA